MRIREVVVATALLVAASCATMPSSCETLYFGTARASGVAVSADEWVQFENDVLTREFPDGMTSWDADGRWRGADGKPVAERSHVVMIVGAKPESVARVIAEYKRRFAQESVMHVRAPCRATF
jgi:hypothetical protein